MRICPAWARLDWSRCVHRHVVNIVDVPIVRAYRFVPSNQGATVPGHAPHGCRHVGFGRPPGLVVWLVLTDGVENASATAPVPREPPPTNASLIVLSPPAWQRGIAIPVSAEAAIAPPETFRNARRDFKPKRRSVVEGTHKHLLAGRTLRWDENVDTLVSIDLSIISQQPP